MRSEAEAGGKVMGAQKEGDGTAGGTVDARDGIAESLYNWPRFVFDPQRFPRTVASPALVAQLDRAQLSSRRFQVTTFPLIVAKFEKMPA